jgi:hypothetical protein
MPTEEEKRVHQQAQQTQELFNQIAPMLVGIDAGVQGNVISMLLGAWLAGHRVVPGDKLDAEKALKAQRDMRARLTMITTKAAFQHAALQDEQRGKPMEVRQ